MTDDSATDSVAHAVERLRLAEARLSRRRQNACGPSESARAAVRFIFDRDDAGKSVTPSDIAEHLEISTSSVTAILSRLHEGGVVSFRRNPDDGRSKFVVPASRSAGLDDIDPVSAYIHRVSESLEETEAVRIARYLDLITAAVDRECI